MNADELKHKLKEIFGDQIIFNRDFDKYANLIKNVGQFIGWCILVKEEKVRAFRASRNDDCVVFIKKLGSMSGCLILKIKNGAVQEIHLGNHRYYDEVRKDLGLKKDSHLWLW